MFNRSQYIRAIIVSGVFTITACGGGGGGSSSSTPQTTGSTTTGSTTTGTTSSNTWVAGEFAPHAEFGNQCAANSTGTDLDEKLWLRSYSNDTYLWYDEIPDPNPDDYSTVLQYFDVLKTPALTPSGKLKDQFHFSMPSDEWELLTSSGASVGYGFNIAIEQGVGVDRKITITYSEPNSPAVAANVGRGAVIVEVDGVDVATANDEVSITTLNNGLFPSEANQEAVFLIQDLGAEEPREVTLSAQTIISDPVPLTNTFDTADGKVGYVIFNDHIATAQSGLYDAFNELDEQGIDELVIDFRYNGGGYLAIASQLGYMVAGGQTQGKTFEKTIFNDKYPTVNPVTGRSLQPTPFYDETVNLNGNDISPGLPLPTVNLSRVFVLTSAGTCSASEAFINGMRGIDIEVIQIGSTTCGKPYGFYAADNCDTTYFTVQFKGENNKGFGDYADGFTPSTIPMLDTEIQGCDVADDLTKPLGDNSEGMLSAALHYLENGQCPEVRQKQAYRGSFAKQLLGSEFIVEDKRARSQFSANRILTK